MDIALMSEKIVIQKNTLVTDEIGNHTNAWDDYLACHASISGENSSTKGAETTEAGLVVDHAGCDFTVRWCRKTSVVTTDGYRVLFRGETYDIVGIDHVQYKRKSIKLKCKKERTS